jgi:hypothetical protein
MSLSCDYPSTIRESGHQRSPHPRIDECLLSQSGRSELATTDRERRNLVLDYRFHPDRPPPRNQRRVGGVGGQGAQGRDEGLPRDYHQLRCRHHPVPDRESGVAVRDAGSARLDRHLHDGCHRLLAVELFLDVGGREDVTFSPSSWCLCDAFNAPAPSAIPAASVSSARNMVVFTLSCAFHRLPGTSATRTIHRPDSTGSVQDSRLALLLGGAGGQEIR